MQYLVVLLDVFFPEAARLAVYLSNIQGRFMKMAHETLVTVQCSRAGLWMLTFLFELN